VAYVQKLPPDVHEVCATHVAALHVRPGQHPRFPQVAPDGEQFPASTAPEDEPSGDASEPDDPPPSVAASTSPLVEPLLAPLLPPLLLPAPLLPPLDALVVPESGSATPDEDSDEHAAMTSNTERTAGTKASFGLFFRTIQSVRPGLPVGPTNGVQPGLSPRYATQRLRESP
jgi:hypothetical protein